MQRLLPTLAAAAALAGFISTAAAQDTANPRPGETCREISRGTAADNSGDELLVRECRRPRAAAAAAPARPSPGMRFARDPTFRPRPENDPKNCKSLWEKIGLPTHAGDAGRDSIPVCHKRYVLLHNNDKRIPDYVLEHLTAAQVSGDNDRPGNTFVPEPAVPDSAKAVDDDYRRSGFARGHQAPSEDFNIDADVMLDTFFFSNVVPQVGNGFNSGIWSTLEARVRGLAVERGEIYVITGPIYQAPNGASQVITEAENSCGKTISLDPPRGQTRKAMVCDANNRDPAVPCGDDGAAVPAALFKIIYDPANDRANAYVLPNIDHKELKGKTKPLAYLERFRTTVHVVEEYTGLRFFAALPARDQRVRKLNCTATMLR
jgi:DNA/RNA endonuclease G (NUC1)